ncbi:hypothetical protein LUZ63_018725 [Rhynchospora breviuscula]|uniref:Reverse transcriptase domain-containing protein n=1 Tax=Rhynchospora breviuscula TaxID=2022672 RepID=A0A9Q0C546_9POAL|nr:hypothetical protein LUZ63_018725 [Rhynchospora breviuscula]
MLLIENNTSPELELHEKEQKLNIRLSISARNQSLERTSENRVWRQSSSYGFSQFREEAKRKTEEREEGGREVERNREEKGRKAFKAENWWLNAEGFDAVCERALALPNTELANGSDEMQSKLKKEICKWLKTKNQPSHELALIEAQLLELQSSVPDVSWYGKYKELRSRYNFCLLVVEAYWAQRSRIRWATEGDNNTSFFHATVASRRRRNSIDAILGDDGDVITDRTAIRRAFVSHYKNIFTSTHMPGNLGPTFGNDFVACLPEISSTELTYLAAQPTVEEITAAVFSIYPDRASGPDGLNGRLVQRYWDLFKPYFLHTVGNSFETGQLDSKMARSNVVLVPKKEEPKQVTDYRPISAFDRMEWHFVVRVLQLYGFPHIFVNWIKACISSASFAILINGSADGFISLTRGLRQGCALSPYLFILCMDILSQMLEYKVASGQTIGIDKSRIWFSKTTSREARKRCLLVFQAAHGENDHTYLGVPIMATKVQHYDYLIDKVVAKLHSWRAKLLSPAAKVTLVKSVVEPMEKTTVPKAVGGLGLRDVTLLNKAMAIKMLWRLLSRECENSLWVKARKVLKPHVKWILGDGRRCRVIGEPWHDFLLQFSHNSTRDLNLKISDLIDVQSGNWNTGSLIQTLGFHGALFIACSYAAPPVRPSVTDRLVFKPSSTGKFSFKKACKLLQPLPALSPIMADIWKVVWRVPGILPRIQIFLWKLVHDSIPIRATIARRLHIVPPPCDICGLEEDDVVHALFRCQVARTYWFTSNLSIRTDKLPSQVIPIVHTLLQHLGEPGFAIFANLIWSIWKARCKQVYEGVKVDNKQALGMAASYDRLAGITGRISLLRSRVRRVSVEEIQNTGRVCTMDGSFKEGEMAGWAYMMHEDGMLVSYELMTESAITPLYAEALALKSALQGVQKA